MAAVIHLLELLQFPIPIPKGATIPELAASLHKHNRDADFGANPNPSAYSAPEIHDFIIIGGGTAGSVLANRLSANPEYSVLLLEAGGDPTILNSIPGIASSNLYLEDTDWFYTTIPTEDYGFAKPDRVHHWSRFKGLGGCSSHNFMIYNRGHPKDYDNWANITGDPSWNYDNVLKYFKKLEDYDGKFPSEMYHGKGGPFHVSNDEGWRQSLEPFNAGAKELGYKLGVDFNGRQEQSFGRVDLKTTKDGRRMDTYTAYIKPVLHRPNLKVIRYAHVQKIELDTNSRAVGVVYKRDMQAIRILANREIICCAGGIASPQLLMLSGIGPAEHIQSVGVRPIVDLPGVGSGMEDHATAFIGPFLMDDPISYLPTRDMKMEDAEEYAKFGTGKFATNGICSLGYISSSVSEDPEWADTQVFQFHLGVDAAVGKVISQIFGLRPGLWDEWLGEYNGRDANFGSLNIARPKSSGTIRLASNNPEDKPVIDPGYFSHPDDMKVMVEGMKFLCNLFENTEAFRKHGCKLAPRPFPGCERVEFKSDAYWECIARSVTSTLYHATTTCRMGRITDPMAVVDPRLKVRNVQGLRVVDASVLPKIPNANINAPILMVAEKAADMIIEDQQKMAPHPNHPAFQSTMFNTLRQTGIQTVVNLISKS